MHWTSAYSLKSMHKVIFKGTIEMTKVPGNFRKFGSNVANVREVEMYFSRGK